MEKPSTVAADEFRQSVTYLANISGLPMFVISALLTEMAQEAKNLAIVELNRDNRLWNEYQKKQEEKNANKPTPDTSPVTE